jgi:WD40-like Beta Propeller Repeat
MKKIFILAFTICFCFIKAIAQKYSYSSDTIITLPTLFAPGVISTMDRETGFTLTPDGKTAYFSKWSPDFRKVFVCESKYEKGKWKEPTIASFSGRYRDQQPFISPDGNRLYFISNRPVMEKDTVPFRVDIWYVEKIKGNNWSEARWLGYPVNRSRYIHYSPSVAANGNIYFTAQRAGDTTRKTQVHFSEFNNGQYTAPREVAGENINTSSEENHVYISPDEALLFFTTNSRPGGYGGEDILFTTRKNNQWQPAQFLDTLINTKELEYLPSVSPDGRYFFFSAIKQKPILWEDKTYDYLNFIKLLRGPRNGQTDIYQIELKEVIPADN